MRNRFLNFTATQNSNRRLIELALLNDYSALRAWREHLGLTQAEVAGRLGISQAAYSQHENSQTLRKSTRIKIATALGINPAQLDF
ncbi:transcriptional regulator [Haemophilus influenzae]|nr:transcriptional regulator [Haemophilus influenzae]